MVLPFKEMLLQVRLWCQVGSHLPMHWQERVESSSFSGHAASPTAELTFFVCNMEPHSIRFCSSSAALCQYFGSISDFHGAAGPHGCLLANDSIMPCLQVSVGKVEAGERATLAIHSQAESSQAAASSTPEDGSAPETRALWRPCIPDNPYDHPLIVPPSPPPTPGTSPLPCSNGRPQFQPALLDGPSMISPADCPDHAEGLQPQHDSQRVRARSSADAATATGEGGVTAGGADSDRASPPPARPSIQLQEKCSSATTTKHREGHKQQPQSQQQQVLTGMEPAARPASVVCPSSSADVSEGNVPQHLQAGPPDSQEAQARQQPPVKLAPEPHEAGITSSSTDPLPQEAYRIPNGPSDRPQRHRACGARMPAAPGASPGKAGGSEAMGEMEWLPGALGASCEDGADHLQQAQLPPPEASASCPVNPLRKVSAPSTHTCVCIVSQHLQFLACRVMSGGFCDQQWARASSMGTAVNVYTLRWQPASLRGPREISVACGWRRLCCAVQKNNATLISFAHAHDAQLKANICWVA